MNWKSRLKPWIPPALLALRRDPIGIRVDKQYPSWTAAQEAAGNSYDASLLTRFRIERAQLNGRSTQPADFLLFAAMLMGKPDLEITDLGGSTGDHGSAVIEKFPNCRYTVVESSTMVKAASGLFSGITFSTNIPNSCDIFYTSSTLPYLDDPYDVAAIAFQSARKACIFARNSFASEEMFHVQESELYSNGSGQIPAGYKNAVIRYPHRTIMENRLKEIAEIAGFALAVRIPDARAVWPSKKGAYGAELVYARL